MVPTGRNSSPMSNGVAPARSASPRPRIGRVLMTADTVGGVWQYSLDLAAGFRNRGIETTIAVMGSVIPSGAQGAFVLLWRFFTLVLNMMIGAGVLVSYLSGKRGRRRAGDTVEAA